MKNHYKVLGIPRNASATQIKQAYRDLIKKCHPDVNSSPKAADWTRELNAAYNILSDTHAKASHDLDLNLEDSKQKEAAKSKGQTHQKTENKPPPKAESYVSCEVCAKVNPSLRISVTWRVESFINRSRKSPTTKILCNKCRIKESIYASIYTSFLGWWSLVGFAWTIESLFKNALGSKELEKHNASFLNGLGYQLYRLGRHQEAYEALLASFKIKPDPKIKEFFEYLERKATPIQNKSFWNRFRGFELDPVYYHAPLGAFYLFLLFLGFGALRANSTSSITPYQRSPTYAYSPTDSRPVKQPQPKLDLEPIFSEPELQLPQPGALLLSYEIINNTKETAPLKITTKESDGNYVMKVLDDNTGGFLGMYFLKKGRVFSIELPVGSYKLKFASGEKWYGTEHLFGPSTAYSYIPEAMNFYISGNYANGHQIELIPQVGGNLKTSKMRAVDW